MIHYKFSLRVFRKNEIIVDNHKTKEYKFQDATELAYSMLHFMRPSCQRQIQAPVYPQSVNIDLPPLENGYNNDISVDIIEVIPVKVPIAVSADDPDNQDWYY